MKKKFLMALFFAGLLVCVPAENTVPARADIVTEKAKVKNGWVTEGNARYYYTDGKKATGFTKISGKTYFFDTKTGAADRLRGLSRKKVLLQSEDWNAGIWLGRDQWKNLLLW